MPITLLKSPAPQTPSAGKASVFVDASDGIPKYVDETGAVHVMAGLPTPLGGINGQVLTKQSSTDGDASWSQIDGGYF